MRAVLKVMRSSQEAGHRGTGDLGSSHSLAISLQTRIHNAVLAGGVAVGPSCHLIPYPSLAMVLGLVAGLVSISGAKCLPVRSWTFSAPCFSFGTPVSHHVVPWGATPVDRSWHLHSLAL